MNPDDLTVPLEKSTPISLRKALVWGKGEILTEAVESLLNSLPAFEVIKLMGSNDVDDLLRQVSLHMPEVVILCQNMNEVDSTLLLRLLQIQIDLKVIILSLESNMLQVYNKQHYFLQDAGDLLSVVQSDPCH